MKKVGILGGISWVSTLDYYKLINQGVNEKMGGLNSAEIVVYSLNFATLQEKTWADAYGLLLHACTYLKKCEVDAIVLAANTAHLYADRLQAEVQIPIISIVRETAKHILGHNIKTVGLLGTKFTMQLPFYRSELELSGLNVIVPEAQSDIDFIQDVVRDELGKGEINTASKNKIIGIGNALFKRGAEALVLGCTELPILIGQQDFSFPVFDTTKIHSDAIVSFIVS